jgi:hypothetical protein
MENDVYIMSVLFKYLYIIIFCYIIVFFVSIHLPHHLVLGEPQTKFMPQRASEREKERDHALELLVYIATGIPHTYIIHGVLILSKFAEALERHVVLP